MTEAQEVRASHDEVVAFVGKLREFRSLPGRERAGDARDDPGDGPGRRNRRIR